MSFPGDPGGGSFLFETRHGSILRLDIAVGQSQ